MVRLESQLQQKGPAHHTLLLPLMSLVQQWECQDAHLRMRKSTALAVFSPKKHLLVG